jgi:hypothetical protein
MSVLVYLDSAVINDIADGKVPPNDVDRLHDAMRAVDGLLVVSFAHIWDFSNHTDHGTRTRVSHAIDAFPRAGILLTDPGEQEREDLRQNGDSDEGLRDDLPLELRSLRLELVSDFQRQVFDNAKLIAGVEQLVDVGLKFVEAERQAKLAGLAAVPKPPRTFVEECLAILLSADDLEEAISRVSVLSDSISDPPMPIESRQQIDLQLRALWPSISASREILPNNGGAPLSPETTARLVSRRPELVTVGFAGAEIRGGEERWNALAAKVAPGLAIVAALARNKRRNAARKVKGGDPPDALHVAFIPYMDLATIDGENLSAIEPTLRLMRPRRHGTVISNPGRDLALLIAKVTEVGAAVADGVSSGRYPPS